MNYPINLTDTYGYYWGEKWINKGTKALNDHANPFNSNSTVRKKVLNPTGKWVYDNRAEIAETLTNVAVSSLVVAGGTAIIVASGGTATPLVLAGLGALGGGLGGGLGKIVKNKINDNKWNKGVIEEIAWGTALGAIPLDKVPGLKKLNKFIDKKLFRYAATGAPAKVWWKRFVGKRALKIFSRDLVTEFAQGLISELPENALKIVGGKLLKYGGNRFSDLIKGFDVKTISGLIGHLKGISIVKLLRDLLMSSAYSGTPNSRKLAY